MRISSPRILLRKSLKTAFEESSLDKETVASELGVTVEVLTDFLTLQIVPEPATLRELQKVLRVSLSECYKMDHYYVGALAMASRRRTSSIRARHVIRAGVPDPLGAESAEALVRKLREVREWAGKPSLRELEDRSGGVLRRATVSDMLRSKSLPRYDRYMTYLEACLVPDIPTWAYAWRRIAEWQAWQDVDAAASRGRVVPRVTA
ncbi:hypothetical protein ACFW2D_17680 [Streptomyces sp. NPDC058914]|uniref:hypothetical protein n=1 Tax=Streptomyces sp. NPDC058914 TaxID=3346671 RepID=UPI00369A5EC1